MGMTKVRITGFEEYKGRGDVKHNSWFRLSNRFLEDHEFFDFTHEEKLVWIYLLSVASQKNTADISVHHRHAEQVCGLSTPSLISAINKLKGIGCLEISQPRTSRGRYVDVTEACATDITDKTDITRQDITPAPAVVVTENPIPVYCEAYKEKYGHSPIIGGRQSGILTRFAKNHPSAWRVLIRGYLQMPDSWAVARSHPVELLESKINEVKRFLETGKVVTRKVVEHAEELIDKSQGTNRKPRRSIEELEAEKESQQRLLVAGDE